MKRFLMLVTYAFAIASLIILSYAFASAAPRRRHQVAAPVISVTGGTQFERDRITKLEIQLNYDGKPMVSYWQITILNRYDWDEMVRQYHIENETFTAFTVMEQTHTFVSEDYMDQNPDNRVKQTIAHEAGHLICECSSESKADEIADALRHR